MKILFIGYGVIARRHHEAIMAIPPDAEVYALRSAKNAAQEKGVKNLNSLVEVNFTPDLVLVTNPTQKHYEAIQSCLRFGSPMFLEKPLFQKTGAAEEQLVKEVEDSGIFTYTGCNLRFHPLLLKLKLMLADENPRINEVNIYCGSYLPDWRPGRNYKEFYSVDPKLGGGVHLDVIHEIDYCYWLFGKPSQQRHILRNKSSLQIEAIDYASYQFVYRDFCASVMLNYYRRDSKRYIEVVTDEYTLTLDFVRNTLSKNDKVLASSIAPVRETFHRQMEYVLDCIKKKIKPINGITEAYEVLKLCLNEHAE